MKAAPRKTVLVTGAARGIGRAIALAFGSDHDVAFTWHTAAPDTLLGDLPKAHGIQADLASADVCNTVIADVVAHFGRVDVIVNNAGNLLSTDFTTHDRADHHALMDLHVNAPAALLAAALPHLDRGAAIVNISSVNAILPPMGAVAYGAAKAAQNLWTKGMAKELGPRGIRVNGVAPGAVNIPEAPRDADLTKLFEDMTALGTLATPQDIANAVRFLASDAASAITGEILTVSGGYRL